jgi:uncharacterized membrane protein
MANESGAIFVFAGEYNSVDEAEVDWEAVKDLHRAHVIGTYDAALVTKDDKGKPKIVHKTEKPTQHGGWIGAGIGALIGLIFPAVLVGGAIGAGVGALVGHLAGGMSRSDLKDIGDMLDEGEAVVLVIGEATIERAVEDALKDAKRTLKKQVDADADALKKAIDAA